MLRGHDQQVDWADGRLYQYAHEDVHVKNLESDNLDIDSRVYVSTI